MLIQVNQVQKLFGAEIVLENASFRIDRREKVALVGRNGAGKTTILKIITGEYEPDKGNVLRERGCEIGYLSQVSLPNADMTVLDVATEARAHLVEIQRRLEDLERKLEHNASPEDIEEYSLLQGHFHEAGGYSVEVDIEVVLKRLGFERSDFSKPVSALSGGERTRLSLAKLLLEEPDLLILDEPTNHLDLDAIEWLEGWIRGYGGAVLVVSHDRVFLQNVAQRVVELRQGTTRSFAGPFDTYLELAKAEDARLEEMAEKQQEHMAKLDEFVRRFMNSQRTAQARGRLKQLEKLRETQIKLPAKEKNVRINLQVLARAGDQVLQTKGVTKGYDGRTLFSGVDWTVRWGDRWGIIGSNGAGKSTLIKIALGEMAADAGEVRLGSNIELGWFAQDADFLDGSRTPLQAIVDHTEYEIGPARSHLGRFLISGDDSMRPIRTLSGGERMKVALAVITALQPNVLVLDEPTNHLDIPSREVLVALLKEFNGTLIVISHDRYLLSQVTQQTMDIRDGEVTQYPGTYDEYRAWRRKGTPLPKATAAPKSAPKVVPAASGRPPLNPRELSKEIARLHKAIAQQEEIISAREADLEALERVMARPSKTDDLFALSSRHAELQKEIDAAINQWTELGDEVKDRELERDTGAGVGVGFRPSG